MIAIDTSALVAIMNDEPERDSFLRIINDADSILLSTVSLLETRLVAFGRLIVASVERVNNLLAIISSELVPFDLTQSEAAFAAFMADGKGVNSKARLNFGDCASYALAKTRGVPLLFKGNDFAATDIPAAVT